LELLGWWLKLFAWRLELPDWWLELPGWYQAAQRQSTCMDNTLQHSDKTGRWLASL
jgi:hypothetical protein